MSTTDLSVGIIPYRLSAATTTPDSTGPKMVSISGTVDGPITVVFDEPVHLGSGSLILLNGLLAPIDALALSSATIDGNTLTVDPGHVLAARDYNLQLVAGAVVDDAGNINAGLLGEGRLLLNSLKNGDTALSGYGDGSQVTGSPANTHDTVVYDGAQSDFTFIGTDTGHNVTLPDGGRTIELTSIERVLFTRSGDELALSLDGNLGQVYRLYQAAFDRTPDKLGFGFWIAASDAGYALNQIAQNFIDSPEFADHYGSTTSNTAYVDALYNNVLHRQGEESGVAYWNQLLDQGVSRAAVLTSFSESAENQAQVTLTGQGYTYTPYG